MRRLLLLPVILAVWTSTGCITREVKTSVYDRSNVEVFLREHKRGFTVVERGFQHPGQISTQRLEHILGAIDIRGREQSLAGIRAVLAPSQLPRVAKGLARGLKDANPNQEIAVRLTSKVMQSAIFNRKYITSFVAYLENDLLYLHFSRVDWQVDDIVKKNALPEPRVGDHPMKFKVVAAEGMYEEGNYAVAVEWRDAIFKRPLRAKTDDRRERTILMEEPDLPAQRRATVPADILSRLTPAQLRELADLEEARQAGRMTEGRYRRLRSRLLDAAGEDSATSD